MKSRAIDVTIRTGFAVLIAISAIVFACKAFAQSNCSHVGPVEVGCGFGQNGCVGDETTCPNDEGRLLVTGLFECAHAPQKWNCRTSAEYQDTCYYDFDCYWDEDDELCREDWDNYDEHTDWIKTADDCQPL